MLTITIPGEPVAQGRGRAFGFQRANGSIGARVFDPQKSRNWKATAWAFMREALDGAPPLRGPVRLEVSAYFTCPKSDHRKTTPRPRRWHTKKPDGDNVLKAVKDAAKGVLWIDDCQVAVAVVTKWIAAQGDAPRLVLYVSELD